MIDWRKRERGARGGWMRSKRHHLYHPTVRERERETGQGEERKQGGEKGDDGLGGKEGKGEKGKENKRHLPGCCAVCPKVSVK